MKNDLEKCEVIHVFKTNLTYKKDVKKISGTLNSRIEIMSWNVDLSDIDRILRIESSKINAEEVIQIIKTAGYDCEELTD